jgi:molybdate transport system substrate-binding protein
MNLKNHLYRRRLSALLLGVLALSVCAAAAELVVLSAGAMEPAVGPILEVFRRRSDQMVTVEFGTAPELTERLSRNQRGDVLIAPAAVMDRAVKDGRAERSSRIELGKIGVGVFVRLGAPLPDVSSRDALRRALRAATAIVYTQGSSGQYIDTLLMNLGVDSEIRGKVVRTADADAALARVAAGAEGDLGFGAITAIRAHASQGTQLVAPLPAALQNFTTYEAAVRTGAASPDAAAMFLKFLATPTARELLRAAGVE